MILQVSFFTSRKLQSICVGCFILVAACMWFINTESESDIISKFLLKTHRVHRTLDEVLKFNSLYFIYCVTL